jgi:hypothetical protein
VIDITGGEKCCGDQVLTVALDTKGFQCCDDGDEAIIALACCDGQPYDDRCDCLQCCTVTTGAGTVEFIWPGVTCPTEVCVKVTGDGCPADKTAVCIEHYPADNIGPSHYHTECESSSELQIVGADAGDHKTLEACGACLCSPTITGSASIKQGKSFKGDSVNCPVT